ncbi:MAG TPA: M20 family metallopeptidase [Candidatus Binataceae bacterium]|nr:M20 family metallopeptidase [Candidatus Binataceae bacterium]
MDPKTTADFLAKLWDESAIPELQEYIRIPNKSVAFDPEWKAHGHMGRVVERFRKWALGRELAGLRLEVVRLGDRTPVLFIEIPGASDDTVLLYGHMDKQPEMAGWRAGLGPWTPVIENDRLYGRGGADDGYAMFACLGAIAALRAQNIPHARMIVIIEACEESGSFDLPHYIEHLTARIGQPSLIVALDSGCGNYEQLWSTTSLRGLIGGTLTVQVLTEGMHSGDAGGVVPCSFRIARRILSRLEDEKTGAILPRDFHSEIPAARIEQARAAAPILGDSLHKKFPLAGNTRAQSDDPAELILSRTWRPALTIIGADGLPPAANAGNVLRPWTSLKLSLRLPPICDAGAASRALKHLMEDDPPYGASVSFAPNWAATGWNAPAVAPWLERSLDAASRAHFGKPAAHMGEGGTIPFMAMLGERFPAAQFLITGVLGPGANAHGPNEFLHIPTAKRLSAAVAHVLADHFTRVR